MFFSEEKNQKTSMSCTGIKIPDLACIVGAAGDVKVFCFAQGGLRLVQKTSPSYFGRPSSMKNGPTTISAAQSALHGIER